MPQYIELTEEPPCPTCGEHLRQLHTRFVSLDGTEKITYLDGPRCPNSCAHKP